VDARLIPAAAAERIAGPGKRHRHSPLSHRPSRCDRCNIATFLAERCNVDRFLGGGLPSPAGAGQHEQAAQAGVEDEAGCRDPARTPIDLPASCGGAVIGFGTISASGGA
jgi:hypothetical protein